MIYDSITYEPDEFESGIRYFSKNDNMTKAGVAKAYANYIKMHPKASASEVQKALTEKYERKYGSADSKLIKEVSEEKHDEYVKKYKNFKRNAAIGAGAAVIGAAALGAGAYAAHKAGGGDIKTGLQMGTNAVKGKFGETGARIGGKLAGSKNKSISNIGKKIENKGVTVGVDSYFKGEELSAKAKQNFVDKHQQSSLSNPANAKRSAKKAFKGLKKSKTTF